MFQVMNKCFTGTVSRLSGVTFEILSREALERHQLAFSERECDSVLISSKGAYHWREGGEKHINEPKSIAHLQVGKNHLGDIQKLRHAKIHLYRPTPPPRYP